MALVVITICAFLYVNTYWFDSVPSSLAQNVLPTTFPRLVLVVIMAITVFLPFEYARKIERGIDLDEERADRPDMIVWITGVALVGFLLAFPWLGALPALILIAVAMPLMWGERRWKILVPYAALFPLAVYLLFSQVLRVNFPRGAFSSLF
ncbi:tripartite tricarboxylate transporter TctB family protein [Roseivivax halodurans]|uniref:tripartite tricarboxylate transporter TctB family protein n=1 Tax=Roseivivax halodurans TaxID=93683 RepID=UPI0004B9783C|nr:tripartite tricarboxylate transporter TctB family protein [Roseivivax halodurans]